ncbi:MAG: sialidase family protein [Acidobacteriota bacterium]
MVAIAVTGCVADREDHQGRARWVGSRSDPGSSAEGEAFVRPALGQTPDVTADGFWSQQLWSVHDDWEPALAVAPAGSRVYQLTTRYGAAFGKPDPAVVFRSSADSAVVWGEDRLLESAPVTQNDPQLVAGPDGRLAAAWIEGFEPGVKVAISSDHGVTWSAPWTILRPGFPPAWSDKPILAASSDGRRVFVAFNASDSWVARSSDFGATFDLPRRTSDDGRYWFHNGGAVGPDGAIWFAAVDFSQDYLGPSHIRLISSRDGGDSWQSAVVDSSLQLPPCDWDPGCPFGFLGPTAAVAVDGAGRVVVAYSAVRQAGGPLRLFVRWRSGTGWSAPVEVGPTSGESFAHATFPALAAGPTPGDFRLVWQDAAAGTGFWNTRLRRSRDGGRTWGPAVRLSDRGDGAPYKDPRGYAFPYGDYLEIEVDAAGREHVVWGEGSGWQGPGNVWWTRRDGSLSLFLDGFESGDLTAWSATQSLGSAASRSR